MRKFSEIREGFFSASIVSPDNTIETFLKLQVQGGGFLFKVTIGSTLVHPAFGNRWVDVPGTLSFFNFRRMDAELTALRYTDNNYSSLTCNITDIEPPPKTIRLIEV